MAYAIHYNSPRVRTRHLRADHEAPDPAVRHRSPPLKSCHSVGLPIYTSLFAGLTRSPSQYSIKKTPRRRVLRRRVRGGEVISPGGYSIGGASVGTVPPAVGTVAGPRDSGTRFGRMSRAGLGLWRTCQRRIRSRLTYHTVDLLFSPDPLRTGRFGKRSRLPRPVIIPNACQSIPLCHYALSRLRLLTLARSGVCTNLLQYPPRTVRSIGPGIRLFLPNMLELKRLYEIRAESEYSDLPRSVPDAVLFQ